MENPIFDELSFQIFEEQKSPKIVSCRKSKNRGIQKIDFKTFWTYENSRFLDLFVLQKFEKIIHRKSDSPWRVTPIFQFFTSLRLFVKSTIKNNFFKLEKSRPFASNWLAPFSKRCTKFKKKRFSTFHFFHKFEKIIHRTSDSPWRVTPICLFCTSPRLFVK